MKQTIQKFALYAILTPVILFSLALAFGKSLDYGTQEILGYLTILLSLSFVFFAIRHFRDMHNHGKLAFMDGLKVGMMITVIVALGIAVADFVYTKFINPDFANEYMTQMLSTMEKELGPEEFTIQKAKLESDMASYSSSWFMAALMFITVAIIGLIVSLLSSLVLQKKG